MTVTAVHGSKERPIIQVSLRDFANRKHEIAKDLWKAATEIGFFYLCDTGISEVREKYQKLCTGELWRTFCANCLSMSLSDSPQVASRFGSLPQHTAN